MKNIFIYIIEAFKSFSNWSNTCPICGDIMHITNDSYGNITETCSSCNYIQTYND